MPTDYGRSARTNLDREYAYMAWGMIGGAVPGVLLGFVVAAFAGHAAMWLSVLGGAGIVVGLVTGTVLYRARRSRTGSRERRTTGAAPE